MYASRLRKQAIGLTLAVLALAAMLTAPAAGALEQRAIGGPGSVACQDASKQYAAAKRKYETASRSPNGQVFIAALVARDNLKTFRDMACAPRLALTPETLPDGSLADPLAGTQACLDARAELEIAEDWRYSGISATGSTESERSYNLERAERERDNAVSLARYDMEQACFTPPTVVAEPSAGPTRGTYDVRRRERGWTSSRSIGTERFKVDGDIPAFFTKPFAISVTPTDPSSVCSMELNNAVDTNAPYEFLVDRHSFGQDQATIEVNACAADDGSQTWIKLTTRMPYEVPTEIVNPASNRAFVQVFNNSGYPATVTLTGPNGVLSQRSVSGEQMSGMESRTMLTVLVPTKGLKRTTSYTLTVANSVGVTTVYPITVPVGWVSLYGKPSFSPCATVRWTYSHQRSRVGASRPSVLRDIRGALARLEQHTSLRFVEVADSSDADLIFRWQVLHSAVGTGGMQVIGGRNRGVVTINSRANGTGDQSAGFTKAGGSSGFRGWLLVHEVMHVLGMHHVNNPSSVMAPNGRFTGRFATADIQGLRTLYPGTCKP